MECTQNQKNHTVSAKISSVTSSLHMTQSQNNPRFSNEGVTYSESPEGLPLLSLKGTFGTALFSPQGAHLIEFTPRGQPPLLFVSRQTHLTKGKAIRGGVPVIFPWFGPREGHPESPMHGLVRTRDWKINALEIPKEAPARVRMGFDSTPETLCLWPYSFSLSIEFVMGEDLLIRWATRNNGDQAFIFEQALHPYFPVSNIESSTVRGLYNCQFIDKTDSLRLKMDQEESVYFTGETDRLYLDTAASLSLEDPASRSRIWIEKTGSKSSVVWNPWIAKAASLNDLDDEDWRRFVCVEQANAGRNAVTLAPGEVHTFEARYRRQTIF